MMLRATGLVLLLAAASGAAQAQTYAVGPLPDGYVESASPEQLEARAQVQLALNRERAAAAGSGEAVDAQGRIEDAIALMQQVCFRLLPVFDGAESAFLQRDMTVLSPSGMRLDQVRNMSASIRAGAVLPILPQATDVIACSVGYADPAPQDREAAVAAIMDFMTAAHPDYSYIEAAPGGWVVRDDTQGRFYLLTWESIPQGLAGLHLYSAPLPPNPQGPQ